MYTQFFSNRIKHSLKNAHFLFFLVITLFLIKGIFYCLFIPPFEAPDEAAHISYVSYLVHNKTFPHSGITMNNTKTLTNSSNFQKHNIFPQIQKNSHIKNKQLFVRSDFKKDSSQVWGITGGPPLYYLYLIPFYIFSLHFPSYVTIIFLRIGSVILGTISLIYIYKCSRLLFPKSAMIPIFSVFLLAFQPMYTFITSVVNNDVSVIFFFSLLTYSLLKWITYPAKQSFRYGLSVSLLVGLATITKPQMLICIFIFSFALFLIKKRITLKAAAVWVGTSLVIPLLWYGIRNIQQGMQAISYPYLHAQQHSLPIWEYPILFIKTKQPVGIFMSFWGYFGWLDVILPKWIYLLFLSLFLLGIGGWGYAYLTKKVQNRQTEKKAAFFLYVSSFCYLIPVWFYDVSTFTKAHAFILQGRYFLPILFPLIVFCIEGVLWYRKTVQQICGIYAFAVFIFVTIIMYITISNFYFHQLHIISPLLNIYI